MHTNPYRHNGVWNESEYKGTLYTPKIKSLILKLALSQTKILQITTKWSEIIIKWGCTCFKIMYKHKIRLQFCIANLQ